LPTDKQTNKDENITSLAEVITENLRKTVRYGPRKILKEFPAKQWFGVQQSYFTLSAAVP